MNHLLRSIAPIADSGWEVLDQEARERLTVALAGRKLVVFTGPLGWDHSATNLGRTDPVAPEPHEGVAAVRRRVLPLVELRSEFTVSREELRDVERGAQEADLSGLDESAHRIACAENLAVFHGFEEAGIVGVTQASSQSPFR